MKDTWQCGWLDALRMNDSVLEEQAEVSRMMHLFIHLDRGCSLARIRHPDNI